MKDLRHICLDKDGTLIDVHVYWSDIIQKRVARILKTFDIPSVHLAAIALAMGVDIERQRIIPAGPVGYKPRTVVIKAAIEAMEKLGYRCTPEVLSELFVAVDLEMQKLKDYNIRVLKNVEHTLKKLQEGGFKISIYSSDRTENLHQIFKKLEIDQYFEALVGGDQVKQPKPHPEGFFLACQRVDIPVSHSIYVGDTGDDMLMAQKAKALAGYGLTSGLCSREELLKETPHVFDGLNEVAEVLLQGRKKCTTPP